MKDKTCKECQKPFASYGMRYARCPECRCAGSDKSRYCNICGTRIYARTKSGRLKRTCQTCRSSRLGQRQALLLKRAVQSDALELAKILKQFSSGDCERRELAQLLSGFIEQLERRQK